MIDETRRTSFDRNATLYEAVRPSYDPRIVDLVRALGTRVLEVGAGTGKATELLARGGLTVTAIEPGSAMADVLRGKQLPNVTLVESRFEDYVGHDFDVVVAAQAWHWVDPAKKHVLAAAAAPHLAVIYNMADFDPALRAELDAAYAAHFVGNAGRFVSPAEHRQDYLREIAESGIFAPPVEHELAWTQRYTTQQYLELISTYSDHTVLPEPNRTALFAAIAAAIDARGGETTIPYVTLVYVARRLG